MELITRFEKEQVWKGRLVTNVSVSWRVRNPFMSLTYACLLKFKSSSGVKPWGVVFQPLPRDVASDSKNATILLRIS